MKDGWDRQISLSIVATSPVPGQLRTLERNSRVESTEFVFVRLGLFCSDRKDIASGDDSGVFAPDCTTDTGVLPQHEVDECPLVRIRYHPR